MNAMSTIRGPTRTCVIGLLHVLALMSSLVAVPVRAADEAYASRNEAVRAASSDDAGRRADALTWLSTHGTQADAPLLKDHLTDADPHVRAVAEQALWTLWSRSGDDAVDEISIKHPKPRKADSSTTYAGWWTGLKSKTGDVVRRIQKGDARLESTLSAIIAIAAAGYGIWSAAWGLGGSIGWLLLPVSAASLVAALILIHARLGLEDRTRVKRLEAFRRYLKDFSDLPNAPALAVVIWEQYLEWAVALGVADEVEKQVRALVPVESLRSPIPGGPTGLAGIDAFHTFQAATPVLVVSSMASVSSGSTSGGFGSSSSSGGFSGGGFSGGGGGGGGGTGGGAG